MSLLILTNFVFEYVIINIYFKIMQNTIVLPKAPQKLLTNSAPVKFLRLFKYELIKVLIFLFLFFASVYYVNSQSKQYYNTSISNTGH